MPLTYNGFFLGTGPQLDTLEGNSLVENAAAIVGQTYGAEGAPLVDQIVQITARDRGGRPDALDQDNNISNDWVFVSSGGNPSVRQTFDAALQYNATITYVNGSTVNITAIVFQTTTGQLYAVPTPDAGSSLNAALTADPIRSIRLNSVTADTFAGLTLDRALLTFPTCFTRGTLIETEAGALPVEALRLGLRVPTLDGGALPVRWIGARRFDAAAVAANPRLRAVRIAAGALAPGLPARPLTVSQQHRLFVRSAIAQRVCGAEAVLVPAAALLGVPGVGYAPPGPVDYWHFAFDRHAVVRAEGAAAESLYPGKMALAGMAPAARAELRAIFPDLDRAPPPTAHPAVPMQQARRLAERHARHARAFV
jgi:hypothetical protein